MTTTPSTPRKAKGLTETLVAKAAAQTYQPINLARMVRKIIYNAAVAACLIMAANQLDGWLSLVLWALAMFRVLPYLLVGVGQRLKDEQLARLAALPESVRWVLTVDGAVFSKGGNR